MKKFTWFFIFAFTLFTLCLSGSAFAGYGALGDTLKIGPNQEIRIDLLGNIHFRPGAADRFIYLEGKTTLTGAAIFTSITTSGAATIGTDLTVIQDIFAREVTLTDDLNAVKGVFSGNVSGVAGIFTGALSGTSGAFSTTLGVTGKSTFAAIDASGLVQFTNSLLLSGNETVGGTFGVTGLSSLSTLNTSGAAELNSLTVTNATIHSGTTAFDGAVTLSDNRDFNIGSAGACFQWNTADANIQVQGAISFEDIIKIGNASIVWDSTGSAAITSGTFVFKSPIILQNDEVIGNTTNGIIDVSSAILGLKLPVVYSQPNDFLTSEIGAAVVYAETTNYYFMVNGGGDAWWGHTMVLGGGAP